MSARGPVRRADRRAGRRQVDRAGGARAAGRGGDLERRGRARALRAPRAARRGRASAGARRSRPAGVVDRPARRPARVRRRRGRARWLEGLMWPLVGARVAAWLRARARAASPPPRGGGRRGAAAVRGGPAGRATTPRSRWSPTRSCGASGPRRAATRCRRARRAPALARRRRRRARRSSCATTAREEDLRAQLSAVLDKLGPSHESGALLGTIAAAGARRCAAALARSRSSCSR